MPTDRSVPQDAGRQRAGRRAPLRVAVYVVLLAGLLLAPLLVPGHPPLVDYPNHFARMVIALEPDETLLRFYAFEWRNMSNLGLELVVSGLAAFMPVALAMEVSVGLVLVLTLGGAVALHGALFGGVSAVAGLAAFFVWGGALQFGFLSYCLGVALALWAVAGWIALSRRRGPQLVLGTLAAVALFYVHVLALGAYGLLIAGIEIDRLFRRPDGAGGVAARLGHAAVSALQFVPPAALLLVTRQGNGETEVHFGDLASKLVFLQRLFWDEGGVISVLMLGVVAVVAGLALWRRGLPVDPRMLPGLCLLALAFAVFPAGIVQGGTPNWALDWRYLTPLALAGTAALRDPFAGRGGAGLLGAAVVALLAGRITVMSLGSWSAGAAQERAIRACLEVVPRGAAVAALPLPMARDVFRWPERLPPVINLPAFAVVDRSAYIPTLFAYDDQQPLRYRPEGLALRQGLEGMYFANPAGFPWARLEDHEYLLVFARPGSHADALVRDLPVPLASALCGGDWFGLYPIAE